jgi:hypothetical protein
MTPLQIQNLAIAWAAAQTDGPKEEDWPIVFEVQKLSESNPEALWSFVLEVLRLAPAESVLSLLAAGPLEDLVQDHGSAFVDRMTVEAKRNERFAALLPKVWVPAATDSVTQRFVQLGCDQVRSAG